MELHLLLTGPAGTRDGRNQHAKPLSCPWWSVRDPGVPRRAGPACRAALVRHAAGKLKLVVGRSLWCQVLSPEGVSRGPKSAS